MTVKEGEVARFDCKVTGHPAPSIMWYFNGKPIKSDDIYEIIPGDEGESSLVLHDTLPEDSGTYTVKAFNSEGEAECSAVLTVEGWFCISWKIRFTFGVLILWT